MRRNGFAALAAALIVATLGSLPGAAYGGNEGYLKMGKCPADPATAHLQLTTTGLRSGKGRLTVVIYGSNPSDFLAKGKKLVKVHLPPMPGSITGCILLPKPGVYALAAYHDEDNDHHMNRSVLGLPAEGYAFSNNPTSLIGLPSFSSVRFTAKAGVTPMTVQLHYP